MLKERMQCELAEKFGEFAMDSEDVSKKPTDLQYAFEYLACRMAISNLGANRTIDTEFKSCKVIEDTFNLPRPAAKLLVQIAYQCPREFRIAHLSQVSQAQHLRCLNMMQENGIVSKSNDFYGEYFSLTPRFMQTIAFGYKWDKPLKHFNASVPTSLFDDLDSEDNCTE